MDSGVRDELAKQVAHAIKRPCKRVWIGKYIHADGVFNVYVSVEQDDGPQSKSQGSNG